MIPTCSYLGCEKPATHRLLAKFARTPWLGCSDHWEAMQKALFIGQPSDSGEVYTEELQ